MEEIVFSSNVPGAYVLFKFFMGRLPFPPAPGFPSLHSSNEKYISKKHLHVNGCVEHSTRIYQKLRIL